MRQDEIVSEIHRAVEEVLSTMLGIEAHAGQAISEVAAPGPTEGVVSLIGLAGTWVGTGSISCSAETARKLSGLFLMAEFDSVNEDVLDAIAELTNMIIGNFKTAMEDRLGPMGLSIPTVIFGRNFTTRTLSRSDWTLIPFSSDQGNFDVHICVAPNDSASQRHPRAAMTEPHVVGN